MKKQYDRPSIEKFNIQQEDSVALSPTTGLDIDEEKNWSGWG